MRKTDKKRDGERYGYQASWEVLKRNDKREARLRQQFEAMWKLTPAQRLSAMRRGELTYRQLLEWAKRAPEEVPMVNGEWEFIAAHTPEIADREH